MKRYILLLLLTLALWSVAQTSDSKYVEEDVWMSHECPNDWTIVSHDGPHIVMGCYESTESQ